MVKKKHVFIQSNDKQILGAVLAKFSILRAAKYPSDYSIEIMLVNELPLFQNFEGAKYSQYNTEICYSLADLQSFTLSRFLPPSLMNFTGRCLVIDPDVFALQDITSLFEMDMNDYAIAACKKNETWDSSVMYLDCSKLKHWNVPEFMSNLRLKKYSYESIMQLRHEKSILELSRNWNSLDQIGKDTVMLHTTNRITQPWKTGLKIDFTRKKLKPLFGIFPREPIHRLFGKYPSKYQTNINSGVNIFFFKLLRDAIAEKVVSIDFIKSQMDLKHVRKDILEVVKNYTNNA